MNQAGGSGSGGVGQQEVYLSDHLASGLGSLPVSGSFAFEREDSFSGGSILESELADDPTESRDFNVPHRGGRLTQEQQEGVEPGGGRRRRTSLSIVLVGVQLLCICMKVCVYMCVVCSMLTPVDDPPVDHLQDDDPLCAVLQEVRHLVLQDRFGFMFGHHLQVVP